MNRKSSYQEPFPKEKQSLCCTINPLTYGKCKHCKRQYCNDCYDELEEWVHKRGVDNICSYCGGCLHQEHFRFRRLK